MCISAPLMVPTNQDSSVVSDTLLHEIVEELSTSWKMLGRWLGVPEAALTNIDIEQRRVIDKGMAMFVEWKRRKGDAATVRVLRDALVKIGRRDLSEKVRGKHMLLQWCSAPARLENLTELLICKV